MKVEPENLRTEDADFVKGHLRCFEFLPSELYEKSAEVILRTGRCVAASLKMFRSKKMGRVLIFFDMSVYVALISFGQASGCDRAS